MPYREDLNGTDQLGIGYFVRTIRKGRRWSAASAFLRPVEGRPNLTIRTGMRVEHVRFEGKRAVGVTMVNASGKREELDGRAVILCTGTIESPKLLQLSGIGPASLLRDKGIEVIADRGAVGRNLREHRMFTMQFSLTDPALWRAREYQGLRLVKNLLHYLLARRGPMATLAYDVATFVRTRPDIVGPDAEIVFAPYTIDLSESSSLTGDVRFGKQPAMQTIGCPLRPLSQGRIMLASPDAAITPVIEPNYLAVDEDIETSIATVCFMRKMLTHPSLAGVIGQETVPGESVSSDAEIEAFVRNRGHCGLHAIGTCRMGADEDAVVDTALRVRGVEGLRVVDCSVMLTMISGHTNAPAMALAWRAADIILEERSREAS